MREWDSRVDKRRDERWGKKWTEWKWIIGVRRGRDEWGWWKAKRVKAARSVVERRGYDSGVFHDGSRAEMGFQITLLALCANLHASMPPTGCTEGRRRRRRESNRGGETSYVMKRGEKMIEWGGGGRKAERMWERVVKNRRKLDLLNMIFMYGKLLF